MKVNYVPYFLSVISDLRREAAQNCALLGYYAASSGTFLPTIRDNLPVPVLRVQPRGWDRQVVPKRR